MAHRNRFGDARHRRRVDPGQCAVQRFGIGFGLYCGGPDARALDLSPGERICIVDDDDWVADSLKVLLQAFGFDVQSYNSGADFLADDLRRQAACLIVDHHMPDMDGLAVVNYLQREGIRLPTILISGRLDTNLRERAAKLGVTNIIEKPFVAGRMVDLIRTALSERNRCRS